MRRKDREMPLSFAYMVADKCEYASLSMVSPEGRPYCVPITIARDGNSIYFHSAHQGFKTECLRNSPEVCLACVGDTCRAKDKFTTEFESAVITGTASEVICRKEKIHALELICRRHTPDNMSEFDSAISKSLDRTAVWKIEILRITGKRKKYDSNGEEMKFARME
ncbi:MAG: pyridoxamine 5'-phosphate oxidase family protein [Candidatus Fimisoma sp.]|nr:pyridoxamine 5'-phosphate oxidase family protein [Bacillota bacterium]MDD7285612.1 pyridoxamine 5'-phosphate oxidase family protein [Bacillota bacterium]MDY4747282.1 pyridoxamine 5'-phosphate oxidase family protein [Candidatus Fimisoma sp.]